MLLEVTFAHQVFEVLAQFAFAEDNEAGVRNLLHDEMRGFDEVALTLVRHQRRDVADQRGAVRQPQRRVHVHGWRGIDAVGVDAFVHRHHA